MAKLLHSLPFSEEETPMKRTTPRLVLIAALLIALTATALALTHPPIINWLLGPDSPVSPELSASVQNISGEASADGVTVRMTGLVYDGTQFAFSYTVENAEPSQPALVLLGSNLTIAGQSVDVPHYVSNTGDARLVPSPHLDVLPVQRNPCTGGGWSNTFNMSLTGTVSGEAFFNVYRPEKAFAVMLPSNSDFFDESIDGEYRAELDDALATLRSFPDVLLVDASEDVVLIDDNEDDAERLAAQGYTVLRHSGRVVFPVDDPRCHVVKTARIAVPFTFNADNAFSCDFSGSAYLLPGCTAQVEQLILTPLTTRISIQFLPAENTEAAARALADAYGPFSLTDESGQPVIYSEMDTMYSMHPVVACRNGQWLVRYREELPGLLRFPQSIGFTTREGELLRFNLSISE